MLGMCQVSSLDTLDTLDSGSTTLDTTLTVPQQYSLVLRLDACDMMSTPHPVDTSIFALFLLHDCPWYAFSQHSNDFRTIFSLCSAGCGERTSLIVIGHSNQVGLRRDLIMSECADVVAMAHRLCLGGGAR